MLVLGFLPRIPTWYDWWTCEIEALAHPLASHKSASYFLLSCMFKIQICETHVRHHQFKTTVLHQVWLDVNHFPAYGQKLNRTNGIGAWFASKQQQLLNNRIIINKLQELLKGVVGFPNHFSKQPDWFCSIFFIKQITSDCELLCQFLACREF